MTRSRKKADTSRILNCPETDGHHKTNEQGRTTADQISKTGLDPNGREDEVTQQYITGTKLKANLHSCKAMDVGLEKDIQQATGNRFSNGLFAQERQLKIEPLANGQNEKPQCDGHQRSELNRMVSARLGLVNAWSNLQAIATAGTGRSSECVPERPY